MKKFKVVAISKVMDAELNCKDLEEATSIFFTFKSKNTYHKVYIMDNETGELYRTYDVEFEGGGVKITEWTQISL